MWVAKRRFKNRVAVATIEALSNLPKSVILILLQKPVAKW